MTDNISRIITRALDPLKQFNLVEMRYAGDTRFREWDALHTAVPTAIIEALQDAGYAIVPTGGDVPTTITEKSDDIQYRTEFRAQMEMPAMVVFAEVKVDAYVAHDPKYRKQYLPQLLADAMWKEMRDRIVEKLIRGIGDAPTG